MCSCDLIYSLRFLLLFGSDGNANPIPADAGRLRERCITNNEKERIDLLIGWIVDLLSSIDSLDNVQRDSTALTCLSSRFVSEVLTAPLFTWKVGSSSYERMLYNPSNRGKDVTKSPLPPPLVVYIHRFINWNAEEVSEGRVDVALNMTDVSLSLCPAPAALCLLANLIQMGKQCDALNGFDPINFHYRGKL